MRKKKHAKRYVHIEPPPPPPNVPLYGPGCCVMLMIAFITIATLTTIAMGILRS